jgi:hypothetical protein
VWIAFDDDAEAINTEPTSLRRHIKYVIIVIIIIIISEETATLYCLILYMFNLGHSHSSFVFRH